jgi:hypothetical protein
VDSKTKMQKISIVSLKEAEKLMSNGTVFGKFETNSLDSFDHSSDYSNNEDDDYSQNLSANTSAEKKEVKRRQRLSHLTVEEKIMRRKLKVIVFKQLKIIKNNKK